MGTETERKFLVKGEFRHLVKDTVEIRQAYLSVDPQRIVRIRTAENTTTLTIKSGSVPGSLLRGEWEYTIPAEEAQEIYKICIPGEIRKTRHIIPHGKYLFEVDVFHGKNEGLIIAEIEIESESEVFEKPDWLGEEVTGNPAYYNSNLIK